ncbi:MAG: hypothetical protein H7Z72_08400, partial [Bacteroidetes bacterium]|nr:hypothetical protein [Fibrella sp.]
MKTHYKWQYLTLAGVLTLAGCTTSRQTAQTGEADDLYGTSANAAVYASAPSDNQPSRPSSQPYTRNGRRTTDQYARNTNPDYVDGPIGDGEQIDYYTDSLTSRKLQRGLSPDPGWGNAYDQGYSNGFNSALAYNNPYFNSSRWNQWGGFGGSSFYGGLGLGLGIGSAFGYSPFY